MATQRENWREDVVGRANVEDTPELLAYYDQLDGIHAGALWTVANKIEPWQPQSQSVPVVWRGIFSPVPDIRAAVSNKCWRRRGQAIEMCMCNDFVTREVIFQHCAMTIDAATERTHPQRALILYRRVQDCHPCRAKYRKIIRARSRANGHAPAASVACRHRSIAT